MFVELESIVGNMMQSVVLDGNPLDEDDGNLLDEVVIDGICLDELVIDVNLICIEGNDERNSVCARTMMKRVCLKAYASLSSQSSVCTREITFQVTYGKKRSKYVKPGVTTMVLTHCIEQ